ncbi:MAG: glycosyltransferase family 4 protein [Solirubrobacteraceae bacterium]
MILTVDLTFNGLAIPANEEERVVTLRELVETAGDRSRLWRLLRGQGYDDVFVLRDERALNGAQAVALLLASLSRVRRFEVRSPSRSRSFRPSAFRVRAALTVAVALPLEIVRSIRCYRLARHVSAKAFSLRPRTVSSPRRVTYIRAEPSLRWLGAQVGGAATHTAGVVNGLSAAGLEVSVFAPERPAGMRGGRCVAVAPKHLLQLARWLTLVGYSSRLIAAAASTPTDFVYQRYALGSYAGLELARRLDVPLVLEFNGSEIWTERHWGSGRVPMGGTLAALELRNLREASLIVVVSQPLKDQLLEQGIESERVLVNPNGVDIGELATARSHPPAHWRSLAELPQAPTVGFVGTFGLWHGVKLLPELIEQVARSRPDARWVLVGGGPLHAEVVSEIDRRGLSELAHLSGVIPHPRAVELLACCDLFVSPHVPNPDGSPFFGSPTKLFEYMGLGGAIVASDLDQIGEVLQDGETALLTPPGDVPVTARAVLRLLGDEELRSRLGAAALREATERYSWDEHVQRILQALASGPDTVLPEAWVQAGRIS